MFELVRAAERMCEGRRTACITKLVLKSITVARMRRWKHTEMSAEKCRAQVNEETKKHTVVVDARVVLKRRLHGKHQRRLVAVQLQKARTPRSEAQSGQGAMSGFSQSKPHIDGHEEEVARVQVHPPRQLKPAPTRRSQDVSNKPTRKLNM